MRMKDKVVLVTGAAGGLGQSIVQTCLNEGAQVALLDQHLSDFKPEAEAARILSLSCDIRQPDQMKQAVDSVLDRFGRLDVAVLNAGIAGPVARLSEYPEDAFDQVMAVNVKGCWLGMKYVVPAMLANPNGAGGSIIAMSSVAGQRGIAQSSAYVASKHAVIGLVKSLAAEVGGKNIRVNAVCPAPAETNMMRELEEGAAAGKTGEGRVAEIKEAFAQKMILRRYAKPEEVAHMVLFLASDESKYCTGNIYNVDGGYTTR